MSTALRTYWRGATLAAMQDHVAGVTRTYHLDHQGTVQCLTDDNGVVTDRFSCDAWGNEFKRTGSSINRHWYIGHLGYYRQVDQALDYVRARYLHAGGATWLSSDPLASPLQRLTGIPAGSNTVTLRTATKQYLYCNGVPTRLCDPSGLFTVDSSCKMLYPKSEHSNNQWIRHFSVIHRWISTLTGEQWNCMNEIFPGFEAKMKDYAATAKVTCRGKDLFPSNLCNRDTATRTACAYFLPPRDKHIVICKAALHPEKGKTPCAPLYCLVFEEFANDFGVPDSRMGDIFQCFCDPCYKFWKRDHGGVEF